MQSMLGIKSPAPDDSLQRQRADAEARAAREKEELRARADEDASQRRSGRRGIRQLFSGVGGFQGFPAAKDTLGG